MYRIVFAALALLGLISPAFAVLDAPESTTQPLDLIVQYKPHAAALAAAAAAPGISLDRIKPGKRIMKAGSEAELQRMLTELRADPNVAYVNRAEVVHAQFVPNDPLYSQQWDKKIQHLDAADDIETGSQKVLVLISDTAFDCSNIADLAPNCRQDLSKNFIADPVFYFHGFYVAGIIAAAINNGIDIAGTAGTVSIAFARFLDHTGSGLTSDGLMTWDYALQLAQQHPDYKIVVNNSWGGGGFDQSFADAAAALKAAGVVVTAAAGNSSNDSCLKPFYPAAYTDVLAVASTDENDNLSSFSNYGTCPESAGGVFIAAPGSNILSLTNAASGTVVASGTSAADPQVSGAIALILSQSVRTGTPISIQDIKDRLQNGSVNLGLPVITGARLDLPGILVAPPPGIRLSLTCPAPAEVNQGGSLACSTSMRGVSGFTGSAMLSCDGVPAAACAVSPTTIPVGGTASVTLTPSTATPSPMSYLLAVHAVTSDPSIQDTSQAFVKVWPLGTAKFGPYISTQVMPFGRVCSGAGRLRKCTTTNVAQTSINVPDSVSVLHLSGNIQTVYQGSQLSAVLTAPSGTAYNIPVSPTVHGATTIAFDTDTFDGELAQGVWTMRLSFGGMGVIADSLNGWRISLLAVPSGAGLTH